MNFQDLDLNLFDYDLPQELIAEYPLEHRDESRLLTIDVSNNTIRDQSFSNIVDLLHEKSLLILNNTKVIAARIPITKNTGGQAEILCVNPVLPSSDPQLALASKQECVWECIIGGRNIRRGYCFNLKIDENLELTATVLEKNNENSLVKFSWNSDIVSFADILLKIGRIPLPPYIHRQSSDIDIDRYQTIYAKSDGSVAAPTAGLHFTDKIFNKLSEKGIQFAHLSLHVGPGTFKPISSGSILDHEMHSEQFFVNIETLKQIASALKNEQNIIATGTTSVRTLESLYWLGVKLINHDKIDFENILMDQWEPYSNDQRKVDVTASDAIFEIINFCEKQSLLFINGKTKLMIVPSYKFKMIDALISNFHLPKSTLILLVSALTGYYLWKEAYLEAVIKQYRFLSYGDSSFIYNF
ncbi:MAG: S-adenosylmethionine:tRNA ribosyltransferase-isomerase [Candidatus Kapabacteria bacterium]|nr:S-adenosylmethionine:tRNA ribosyltransferase-isomerase [Candidatus Kapabacteria bacterium]